MTEKPIGFPLNSSPVQTNGILISVASGFTVGKDGDNPIGIPLKQIEKLHDLHLPLISKYFKLVSPILATLMLK